MTNKTTKGYTKSNIDLMKVFLDMKKNTPSNGIYKNPNEPLEKWILRKSITEESAKVPVERKKNPQ